MDVVLIVICAVFVIGILVFIHEGGHFLAARAFGVRVTEFMLGLPGPRIGFTRGETTFGVTIVPLGGYARVCGMEAGEMSPHLEPVLAALYRRGTAHMEDVARDCDISDEEALAALDELVEWGSAVAPRRTDRYNTYRTPALKPTKRQLRRAGAAGLPAYEMGEPRPVDDPRELFESEFRQQYRALPFWKRSVILLAGVAANIVFAMIAFVIVYSVIGFDYQYVDTGEIVHVTVSPLQSIQAGFLYVGTIVQAVANLFNPATAAETVSQSTSIVGIAVLSKTAFEAGLTNLLVFMAMISVSLGVMNALPIPPLDGGKFVIEVVQKASKRLVPPKVVGYVSAAGMLLFLGFFAIMLNQDIQRFVFGNWG